ncbi:hypothetical protein LTR62_003858 [Meristemomyces frigidus]|uniref:Uncharacterized protein n=1 Tax=Meristemomyces frigidus TaxID=1508187 RepID=A0AAN7TJ62_9PEZI|nr:hypothetical protein LTR62_003858 [Meristemomyces frigidus]
MSAPAGPSHGSAYISKDAVPPTMNQDAGSREADSLGQRIRSAKPQPSNRDSAYASERRQESALDKSSPLAEDGRRNTRLTRSKQLMNDVLAKRSETANERGKLNQLYADIFQIVQDMHDTCVVEWPPPDNIDRIDRLKQKCKRSFEDLVPHEAARMKAETLLSNLERSLFQEEQIISAALASLPSTADSMPIPMEDDALAGLEDVQSVSDMPPQLQKYYRRAGDLNIWKERLQELEFLYVEGVEQRDFLRDRGEKLNVSDDLFDADFERKRTAMAIQLESAEKDALRLAAECRAAGWLTEEDREVSSSNASASARSSIYYAPSQHPRSEFELNLNMEQEVSQTTPTDSWTLGPVSHWLQSLENDPVSDLARPSSLHSETFPEVEDVGQKSDYEIPSRDTHASQITPGQLEPFSLDAADESQIGIPPTADEDVGHAPYLPDNEVEVRNLVTAITPLQTIIPRPAQHPGTSQTTPSVLQIAQQPLPAPQTPASKQVWEDDPGPDETTAFRNVVQSALGQSLPQLDSRLVQQVTEQVVRNLQAMQ